MEKNPDLLKEIDSAAATYAVNPENLRALARRVQEDPRVDQSLVTQISDGNIDVVRQTDKTIIILVDTAPLRQILSRLYNVDNNAIDALLTAHTSHMIAIFNTDRRENIEARLDEQTVGFELSMPSAVGYALKLVERTVLKPRESQVWALKHEGCSHSEIAGFLEISKGTVDALSSRIRARVERSHATTELVTMSNQLTKSKTDVLADDYLGLDWSSWVSLDPESGEISELPTDPGLYRVRNLSRDRLMYVGETGRNIRGRVSALARGMYADEMPYLDPHVGAPRLWAIRKELNKGFEVSVADPEIAADTQHRKGIEASLIAIHHRELGCRPTANFSKIIPGYKMSSYRSEEKIGGPTSDSSGDVDAQLGQTPPSWDTWRLVTDDDWLGQDWSTPRPLSKRLSIEEPSQAVYRIWYDHGPESLAYIGETTNVSSRLRTQEKTFGPDALFSIAPVGELLRHERHELEIDLIGAHYLALGKSPIAQFGRTDRVPLTD